MFSTLLTLYDHVLSCTCMLLDLLRKCLCAGESPERGSEMRGGLQELKPKNLASKGFRLPPRKRRVFATRSSTAFGSDVNSGMKGRL